MSWLQSFEGLCDAIEGLSNAAIEWGGLIEQRHQGCCRMAIGLDLREGLRDLR